MRCNEDTEISRVVSGCFVSQRYGCIVLGFYRVNSEAKALLRVRCDFEECIK